MLADEVADAAAQRESSDTDGAGVAKSGGEAVGIGCGRVLGGGDARLGPGHALFWIDNESSHVGEIEHDPSVGHPVARDAVTAATDDELCAAVARECDYPRDIVRIRDADDHRRPSVDAAVERTACRVVLGVVRPDHPTGNTVELWGRLRNHRRLPLPAKSGEVRSAVVEDLGPARALLLLRLRHLEREREPGAATEDVFEGRRHHATVTQVLDEARGFDDLDVGAAEDEALLTVVSWAHPDAKGAAWADVGLRER